jgi:aryl-alcohol dehydrogenase-like predicted oxidoreductase
MNPSRLDHHATLQDTTEYFRRLALPAAPISLGKTGLFVSPIGFGGYRVEENEPLHREALSLALLSGCNLIDTSANYTGGSSEKLIGTVLSKHISSGKIKREEIVLVSKAGYVQGSNLELAQNRENEGHPFPDMVKYRPDCWHCISPEFLEDQITRSLERLGVTTIDVLLLHNPEYYLKTPLQESSGGGADHREYYARIRRAFEYLETECEQGRIRWYGISSNSFPSPKEDPEYTSLETVIQLAQEISATNHFAVIQFPMNLFEPGAVFEENNSGRTVAALARENRIGTLVNRPLNAFFNEQLLRLTDFPAHEGENIVGNLKSSWTRTMELEQAYPRVTGKEPVPAARFAWGHILRQNFSKLSEIDVWQQTLHRQIAPSLEEALKVLAEEHEFREWTSDYRAASTDLFDSITAYLENQAAFRSDKIAAALDHSIQAIQGSPSLSRKVIRLYRSIPGISCVLVGMRRPEYVRDILTIEPPLPEAAVRAAWLAVLESHRETEH